MLSALQSFDMKDAEHWAEGMDGVEWHKWDWIFRKVVFLSSSTSRKGEVEVEDKVDTGYWYTYYIYT